LRIEECSDVFSTKGRRQLALCLTRLPSHTRYATELILQQLDSVTVQIVALEGRMKKVFKLNQQVDYLMSIPGVGFILAVVILSEVGDVERFLSASHLASYAGTTPTVHASGGKVRLGRLRPDVNHYLKWAFTEAANTISRYHRRWPHCQAARVYERVRSRRGHQTAIGAVARQLAEATYWMLKKGVKYKEPKRSSISSTKG
jgi:transposase